MEQITEYILSLLAVLEKETKLLRFMAAKSFMGMSLFAVGAFVLGAGLLMFAWTCFTALCALVGQVWAGLIAAILMFLGGGVLLWIGKRNLG